MIQFLAHQTLTDKSFEALLAEDGREVLEIFEAETPYYASDSNSPLFHIGQGLAIKHRICAILQCGIKVEERSSRNGYYE